MSVRLLGGGIQALVQVLVFGLAISLWRLASDWTGAGWLAYFATVIVIGPMMGRLLAWNLLRLRLPCEVWKAWPASVAAILVLLFGHGFEEAGLGVTGPLFAVAVLTLLFGSASEWAAPLESGRGQA